MSATVPSVMVSSTFYDLRQIRADLTDFLSDELGFVPLLSEIASFPVDPDLDTIENCRRRVQQDADILVLVIGGRYGAVDSASSRSVTNLEYLAARAKGIPIFAFVDKRVLAVLSTWQKNPTGDFSAVVDDVRVFEFINELRSVHRVWTHEFESAQQIVAVLRSQFAHITLEGIRLARRLHATAESSLIRTLGGKALRLALERPEAWEYRLFAQCLIDEVAACGDLKRRFEIGVALGVGEHVTLESFNGWVSARIAELKRVANAINLLMNTALAKAFGPSGHPGDPEAIAFVAKQVAACYREALEWADRVRRASSEEELQEVLNALSVFSTDIIEKIEEFGTNSLRSIEDSLASPPPSGSIHLRLTVGLTGVEDFSRKTDELTQRILARQRNAGRH
jgi:hypothetical protein